MRIRRCASRVLGSSASAPALPRFELPPPYAGSVAASATSCSFALEPCKLSLSPWDLMDQLHPSDPQAEKIFLDTYFVTVAWRPSWLFQSSMPAACSIKEEEQQQEEDMADSVIFELHVCGKNAARKKNGMKPNMNKVKIKAEESDATTAGGHTPVWRCKRNGGKTWFCRRPASRPNSFCSYHSDQKPKRKRDTGVGEGFYYYAGFGARSKRHRVSGSSSDAVPAEPPPPAGQEEEAAVEEEKHIDFTAGQAEADNGAEHQPAPPASVVDGTAGIAGWDEEESSDDGAVKPRDMKRKSPLKKRWRKPVKARSLKSLM